MIYVYAAIALLIAYLAFKLKNWGYQKAKKEEEYQKNVRDKIFLSQLRDKDSKVYKMWQKNRENESNCSEDEEEDDLGIGSCL